MIGTGLNREAGPLPDDEELTLPASEARPVAGPCTCCAANGVTAELNAVGLELSLLLRQGALAAYFEPLVAL